MSRETDSGILFSDELTHLSETVQKLDAALQDAQASVMRIDEEYRDAKRYMAENRGEIDPHEMFQNELLLKQTDKTGAFAVRMRDQLAKLKDSPYFARIDFRGAGFEEAEAFYIGRFAFSYLDEPLIFDWRAPVASMFYDCEAGPAGYDAPMGRIGGELTRKRQFKIRGGVMEYALESACQVQDEILQKELSQTSDEKMKSIISTIQKEQNRIIRSEELGTLIIQGVAGSGKTSIALHRIAFLLYRYRDRLSARNVAILSPNKVFGDYIGGVIPELGEEPVYELRFSDLAQIALEGVMGFEPEKDPLETGAGAWRERVRFKSTMEFAGLLEEYIKNLPGRAFAPADYTFDRFTAHGEWIRRRYSAYGNHPVKKRLALVADDILQRFQAENIRQDALPTVGAIRKSLAGMLTVKNTLALYKDFYKTINKPQMFVLPQKKTLEWADVAPFLYLHAAFEGVKQSGVTRHLVIDEMQDYTPIQYLLLNKLFPCQKTILGDFGQLMNPCLAHTLPDLRRIYEGAGFVELRKSYRSTYEIMTYAKGIQGISALQAVKRHGAPPAVIACGSARDEIERMKQAVRDFGDGENVSLGIVLKTDKAAKAFYAALCGAFSMNLLTPQSTCFAGGVTVTSIRMAKGLEFDEVLVPQADSRTYSTDEDRRLLYIACTRALHRLTLLYTGAPSRFLPKEEKTE